MTRLRDLDLAVGSLPTGELNAITDVAGVQVGHATIVRGEGPLRVGEGPVRTGVTVVETRPGSPREEPVFAGAATLNGNGELTGLEWVRESGLLSGPVALTNTHSVGVVRDTLALDEANRVGRDMLWVMPVVGETFDGVLNDVNGGHVTAEHVRAARAAAASGPVPEGNVGGGTGMICHEFKGGIGTSSRLVEGPDGPWTVGVLVQANYGARDQLRVDGLPVGRHIPTSEIPSPFAAFAPAGPPRGAGSIILVTATDAPLLPDQCRRLALRSFVGLSRAGGYGQDGSGDIAIAFSTGNRPPAEIYDPQLVPWTFEATSVPHQRITQLLLATVEAAEEAILNALLQAETMTGRDGVTAHALTAERLLEALAAARR
ncbi:MAG TPA: P1 family peptidase [Gaiellaceae bacterium]|nr:P1 family peptidase [Gaiellaceae bacterium]